MPRYHFNVQDGGPDDDSIGTVLPGLQDARTHAMRYAADLLREASAQLWSNGEWSMTVTDERHLALFSLTMIATDAPSTIDYRHGLGSPLHQMSAG